MKKALSLILAIIMLLALCACGTPAPAANGNDANAPSNQPSSNGDKTDAPADGTVYTLRFASTETVGNDRYELYEKPIMDLITEKTNGRIQFEFYPSSTLCGSGAIIKGMQDGICDIGADNINSYPGAFPYAEMLQIPGVSLGETYEEKYANMKKFGEAYAIEEAKNQGVFTLFNAPANTVVLMSKFPVETLDSYKSKTVCCNGTYAPMFTDYGAANTWVIPPEQYEAFHLNVIDATVNGIGVISAFNLFEVLDYAYYIPFSTIATSYYMSMSTYNSLPEDLQAILDDLVMCDEFLQISKNYCDVTRQSTMDIIAENNPNFVFADLPADVSEAMQSSCAANIADKIASLNAAGLDGDGALALVESFAK